MTEKSEEVEAILGKPVSAEMTAEALKVRRNLLIASFVSIGSVVGNVHVDPASTILGLRFLGLDTDLINRGLLIVTAYLLAHFAWYFFDSFVEWRIRLTGTRVAYTTGAIFGSEEADYPSDPRQSTLHNWWLRQSKSVRDVPPSMDAMCRSLADWQQKVELCIAEPTADNKEETIRQVKQLRSDMTDLKQQMESVERIVSSMRIPVSLGRFDNWFALFLRSQNIRWLLIDAGMPLALGAVAMAMLIRQIVTIA